jgi:hypothetical protein
LDSIFSHINPAHTVPSYFSNIHFNITFLPTYKSSHWSLSFWISHQNPSPYACYIPCQFHPLSLDQSNYIWQRVQVMSLHSM